MGILDRVAQGAISFGSGIPSAQIDTIRSNRDVAQQNVELNDQTIAANDAAVTANAAEAQRQQQIQQLQSIAFGGGPDADKALTRLFQVDPEIANTVFEGIGARSQSQREDAARRAAEIQATPFDQREAVILRQSADGEAQGRDFGDTRSLLSQTEEEQNNSLRMIQAAALSAKERASNLKGGGSKLGQSVVTKDAEGNLTFATPVLTGGQVSTQQTPIAGQIVSRQAGETSGERQQRDIDTAGGKSTAVAVSKRDQDFIDVGQRQADGTAVIRRGLQLLDTVSTGRPEAITLAAKNLFGIAGADETELNANLGKAILSQLRTTFGAQFTENEGKRLESIESNFGKSTVGNIRLLKQALKGMERDARRGVDAAKRNKDTFSIKEIEDALKFDLGTTQEKRDSDVVFSEGDTATDANGKKIVFKNGNWVSA